MTILNKEELNMIQNDKMLHFKIIYEELKQADVLGDEHMIIEKAYDNLIYDYQKSRELNTELMEYLKEYEKVVKNL